MTHATLKTAAVALFLAISAIVPVLTATAADAGSGKEFFSQTYTTSGPMNGYEGRAGNYYCSYTKKPVYKCDQNGNNCVRVAWELEQHCY